MLSINDDIGILASLILVLFRPPSAEFVAIIDVAWIFSKEDKILHAVWRRGRINNEGDV